VLPSDPAMRDAVHVERQDQRKARWIRYPGNSTGFDHRPSQLVSPVTRRKFEQATPAIAACPIVAKLGTAINSLARMTRARARADAGGRPETGPGAARSPLGLAGSICPNRQIEATFNGESMHPLRKRASAGDDYFSPRHAARDAMQGRRSAAPPAAIAAKGWSTP
jgi:hypothetical protein